MDAELQAAIIEKCTNHKSANWRKRNYRACVTIGTQYFVKFGTPKTLEPEAATQAYIHRYAESDTAAPRVAKILFHFQEQLTMYIVMEYIELVGPADLDRKANALDWLSKVVPAPGHVLGPVGGGRIRHAVFKDGKAPLDFDDLGALERYLERARGLLSTPGQKLTDRVSICNDRVMFSQSDMDESNFGVDKDGRTVIMDFESIGLVPQTLVLYTLSPYRLVLTTLGLSSEANLKSLCAIASCLGSVADPKIGLGNDGKPKAPENARPAS